MADEMATESSNGVSIVLYDRTGQPVTYDNIETITTDTPVDGETATFTHGVAVSKTVPLEMAVGNQIIKPDAGELLSEVTVEKPETLISENIAKDVEIAGIKGEYEGFGASLLEDKLENLDTNATKVVPYGVFNRENLVSVNMPLCSYIGASAFQKCIKLKTVNLPNCLRIDNCAFLECSNINQVNALNCTFIGDSAFYSAVNLSGFLYMPDKFEFVGYNAFGNSNMFSKYVSGSFTIMNGCIIAATGLSTLTGTLSLPDDATCVGQTYMPLSYKSSITSIYGKNIKGIANYTFYQCSSLKTVNFPNCKYVGKNAFFGTSNITSIVMPNLEWVDYQGFSSNKATYVNFPLLKSVPMYCFANWYSLTSASLESVEEVGSYAFSNCSKLGTISLPNCIKIHSNAFRSCSSLSSVYLPEVKYIGDGGIWKTRLTNLSLPKCEFIGSNAIQFCYYLSSVYAPECTYLSQSAFCGCSILSNVSLPKVSNVGYGCFLNCYKLSEIDLPECIEVGSSAFAACSTLANINLPKCKYIGSYAFNACSKLSQVSLPECIEIGNNAFYSRLTLLREVYLLGSSFVNLLGSSVFYFGTTTTGQTTPTFYFRESMLSEYKSMQYWSIFSSKMIGLTDEEIEALNN